MATKTTNYGLEKPDGTDFYDVDVQNSNMDIIDKQMKANANAITQLNSDSTFIKRESDNLYVYKNKDIAIVIAYFSISVTGGGYDNVYQLPDGVNFVNEVFAPCVILNPNWAPVGITGDIRVRNTTLTIRSSDSMENGVVVANITVPSSFVNFS